MERKWIWSRTLAGIAEVETPWTGGAEGSGASREPIAAEAAADELNSAMAIRQRKRLEVFMLLAPCSKVDNRNLFCVRID
tara:strand:- start:835 stop:1074 length:240 start_codon:yes stop_codon:yes gene_type:complete